MEIFDLDCDLPESDKVSLSLNGKKYTIPLTVSYGLGCYMLSNKDLLSEIFDASGKPMLNRKTLDFAYAVAVELIKEQDPKLLTDEYIKKHLSVPKLIILLIKMASPFIKYMNQYGGMLIGSPATDDKNSVKKNK